MNTQHTPGPWYSIPGKPWIVECQNGQGYNLSIADCSVSFNLDPEEQKANARLIASAPTMYAFIAKLASEGVTLDNYREAKSILDSLR